jgi:hypothetical protein
MITEGNNPTDGNDPLKDAYQRLQEARDNCIKSDLNNCPLDELTTLTEELKAAKEGFDEALEQHQQTNTVTVGHYTIWKHEFEALESLAKLNGIAIYKVLHGFEATENGRITRVWFPDLGLTDISPLAQLTQLKGLELNDNQIQDISPLAQLTQLTTLDLEGNEIQDISPLAHLTQVKGLFLGINQIQDISPLAQLTQLTRLGLNHNQIQDISPLAQLTLLERLLLNGNQIQDISPLAHLNQLTRLSLDNNQIQDTRENRETLKKLGQQVPRHGGTFHRDTFLKRLRRFLFRN